MNLMISSAEYEHRLDRLRDAMSQIDIDVLVISALDSIYYLTGAVFEPLERPFFLLVYPDRAPVLLVPLLDLEHMKQAKNVDSDDIKTYREFPAPQGEDWPTCLRELIGAARRVGVEASASWSILQEVDSYSPIPLCLIEELRLIKSTTEMAMIRRAAEYADLGVQKLLAASHFGATVCEGFAQTGKVTARIIRESSNFEPLTTKVLMATWAAPRSAEPHTIPALDDQLRDGPHVALVLTRVNGYAAESERTYFTKPPTADEKQMFQAMQQARRRAFALIRPGAACQEIDQAVNEFLLKEGYESPAQRLHRTGHGIGLGNHEGPWIAEGSTDVLQENMVISIEPGIYLPEKGGMRHSDTVQITHRGYELLTRHPWDVETLTLDGWRPVARFIGWLVRRSLGVKRRSVRRSVEPVTP